MFFFSFLVWNLFYPKLVYKSTDDY